MISWRRLITRLWVLSFASSRVDLYRDLASMYRRSEPMLSWLEGELSNARLTGQRARAVVLGMVLARYTSGADGGRIEYLLRPIVPAADRMMLASVGRAVDKAAAFDALADAVSLQQRMRSVVLGQAVLPAAILVVSSIMIAIVARVLQSIDKSTPIYVRDEVWAGFNGLAKALADYSLNHGVASLLVITAGMALVLWSLPRWRGTWRLRADRLPMFSLYRDLQAGLVLSAIAMMLRSGETLRGTLEDLATDARPVLRWQLLRVIRSLDREPTRVVDAFSRGLLSPYLLARMGTLARSAKSLPDVLVELGTSEGDRVLARVRRTAVIASAASVGLLASVAATLGVASMTVPATFAAATDPTHLMLARQRHEAREALRAQAPSARPATGSSGTSDVMR